jgi:hypothetical protein
VTTENNKKAEISQGTKIPVQTNVNNTITTTFLDFSLKLDGRDQRMERCCWISRLKTTSRISQDSELEPRSESEHLSVGSRRP